MNARLLRRLLLVGTTCLAGVLGCASPYRSDQGALLGGLGGAGLGALSGAAVGGALDDIEAQNRAEIAARLGRPAPTGSVTIQDVIGMTRAGVAEDVILTHIRYHGAATPLQPADLITLQQQGVSPRVVQALQAPPPVAEGAPVVATPYVVAAPPPYWGPPYPYAYPYPYPYPYYGRPCRGHGVHWGVSVGR